MIGTDDHRFTIDFKDLGVAILETSEYMIVYDCPYFITADHSLAAPYFIGLMVNGPAPFGTNNSIAYGGINWRIATSDPPSTFELATTIRIAPEPFGISPFALAVIHIATMRRKRHLSLRTCPAVPS
jgi:hypothetical protein